MQRDSPGRDGQSLVFCFEITGWSGEIDCRDPDGFVSEARFFSLDEAISMLGRVPWWEMRETIAYLRGEIPGVLYGSTANYKTGPITWSPSCLEKPVAERWLAFAEQSPEDVADALDALNYNVCLGDDLPRPFIAPHPDAQDLF